jgi:outer membrane protein, heavy metal efflux system
MIKEINTLRKIRVKRRIVTNAFFAILLSMTAGAFSQSVDSLVVEAMRANPRLKAMQSRIASAEHSTQAAKGWPAPTLGVEFSQIPYNQYNVWDNALSNSISLSQMFMLGGKISAMVDVERSNEQVTRDTYFSEMTTLTAQVKMAYYQQWMTERQLEVAEKTLSLLDDLVQTAQTGFQIGRTEQADVLMLQSEQAAQQIRLVVLQKEREAGLIRLNQLLGRDLQDAALQIDKDVVIDPQGWSPQELTAKLRESNPELKKMTGMIAMNRAMISEKQKQHVPDLMLGAMAMRMPRGMIITTKSDPMMREPKTEYMYSLMASITLPFMPWSAVKWREEEQEYLAAVQALEYERSDMERRMSAQLQQGVTKMEAARESVRLYQTQVIPLAEQTLQAQITGYQNGRVPIYSLIESLKMLLMQQMNLYMSQADYLMAKADVEMMLGKSLQGD